jgi:hypothetical protein
VDAASDPLKVTAAPTVPAVERNALRLSFSFDRFTSSSFDFDIIASISSVSCNPQIICPLGPSRFHRSELG